MMTNAIPWPSTLTRERQPPTSSAVIIQECERFLADRAVLPDDRFSLPLVLVAAHTHCWEACGFDAVGYVNFTGVRGSGKNHVMHTPARYRTTMCSSAKPCFL